MNPTTPLIIRTDQGDHNQFIKGVVNAVASIIPSFTHTDARPTTPETPVAASPELEAVGAQRVGSEQFTPDENWESGGRDAVDVRNWIINKIKGGGSRIRLAPSKLVSKIKRIKAAQEAQVISKHDSSQLDTE